jgi:hypothetical protein
MLFMWTLRARGEYNVWFQSLPSLEYSRLGGVRVGLSAVQLLQVAERGSGGYEKSSSIDQ